MSCPPKIHLARIGQRFGDHEDVIQGLNLELQSGEFAAIVGPSGCGKSTLLRIIAGLIAPTSGSFEFAGNGDSPLQIGFVFQQSTLLPWRRVLDNIALPLELRGVASSRRMAAADAARKLVGLADADLQKLPRMLSGGMQMRVSIARALVTDPQVMLLDEPFAALDDILRSQLNQDLCRLWLANQWTTLFVTHNVSEAVFLSQRVLIMSPRPGTIVHEVPIPLAFPRRASMRATPEFARLVGDVSGALLEATQ